MSICGDIKNNIRLSGRTDSSISTKFLSSAQLGNPLKYTCQSVFVAKGFSSFNLQGIKDRTHLRNGCKRYHLCQDMTG